MLRSWPRAFAVPELLWALQGDPAQEAGTATLWAAHKNSYVKPQFFKKHLEKNHTPGPISLKSMFLSVSLENATPQQVTIEFVT